ncbi:MAG TPA: cytochrome c [Acidobacteriaceae bacterium]|nr:cytochrome c [Acidobacteriaceae bacterium]
MRFLIGLVIGFLLVPIGAYFYLHYGNPPVSVADPAFPFEKQIVHVPLNARVKKEMPKSVPIQATPDNLTAGAQIYRQNCAFCHGLNNQNSTVAPHMYPSAPQLWHAHGPRNIVGVSDDPPGETYWKVANGIRLTGMPSFQQILSSTQMWQVSVLLANADKPLPQAAMDILAKPLTFDTSSAQSTTPTPATTTPTPPAK